MTNKIRWLILNSIFCLLYSVISPADARWCFQESGTLHDLYGVWFVDSSNGWACGENGTILHTFNNGESWISQTSGTSEILQDVFFWDANNGWAVGGGGVILHTTNGGESWFFQNVPIDEDLYTIQFVNLENGCIGGAHLTLLETTDGGNNWTGSSGDSTAKNVLSIFRIDTARSSFTYDGKIYFTFDGGQIWWPFPDWGNFPHDFLNLWGYLDQSLASSRVFYWIAGEHGFIMWVTIYESPLPFSYGLVGSTTDTRNLYGLTLDLACWKLWAVGQGGWIISSVDSGKTWQEDFSNTEMDLYAVSFPDSAIGWAVGESGTILRYCEGTGLEPEEKQAQPNQFQLLAPYPNPCNQTVSIEYNAGSPEKIYLELFDISGRLVRRLINGEIRSGHRRICWDGRDKLGREVCSGVYLCRLKVGAFIATRKLVIIR